MKPRVLSSALLPITLAIFLFQNGYIRFNYPAINDYPVRGIDISHHQGAIDWPALERSTSADFAFIKASEGADHRDSRFTENWQSSQGLLNRGAYHFFTFCKTGEAQANNFLSVSRGGAELPSAIDIEFSGNCSSWESLDAIRAELKIFLASVKQRDGRTPILYVTKRSYNRIIRGHFPGIPIWIREVVFRPTQADYPGLLFWQYAGNGRQAGVDTLVDLNVFVGRREVFDKLMSR